MNYNREQETEMHAIIIYTRQTPRSLDRLWGPEVTVLSTPPCPSHPPCIPLRELDRDDLGKSLWLSSHIQIRMPSQKLLQHKPSTHTGFIDELIFAQFLKVLGENKL